MRDSGRVEAAGGSASPATGSETSAVVLSFLVGLFLALMQFSYFFLLEAYLSSRAVSFFVALFFWLVGMLVGLNRRPPGGFPALVGAGVVAYGGAALLVRVFPYDLRILPAVGGCITVSGAVSGRFFPHAMGSFARVKHLLFHENNGFLLGILLSLLASVFAGKWLLAAGPAAGALPVAVVLLYRRGRSGSSCRKAISTSAAYGSRTTFTVRVCPPATRRAR